MTRRGTDDLSPIARRHLHELLNAPHWRPETPGEWQIARALERRGYLVHNPTRGHPPYTLTDAGRHAALALDHRETTPWPTTT